MHCQERESPSWAANPIWPHSFNCVCFYHSIPRPPSPLFDMNIPSAFKTHLNYQLLREAFIMPLPSQSSPLPPQGVLRVLCRLHTFEPLTRPNLVKVILLCALGTFKLMPVSALTIPLSSAIVHHQYNGINQPLQP